MSNSDSNVTATVHGGGVTQVQHHGSAPAEYESAIPPPQGRSSIVHQGAIRSTAGGGIEQAGITRVNASEMRAAGDGGILSTATNAYSSGPARDLNAPSTLLMHGGMQITMATALQLGLVQRDANGNYTEGAPDGVSDGATDSATDEALDAEQQAQAGGDAPVAFSPELETTVTTFADQFAVPIQDALIAQIIGGNTSISQADAEAAGMSADHATGMAGVAIAAFTGQAQAFMASRGVDFAEFTEWAHATEPDAIKSAMRQHAFARTPSAYGALVEKYLRSTPPSAEALAGAGIPTKQAEDGTTTLVQIKGTWMSLKSATRMGLL